ncbi:hypothetical protein [Paenibacillus luteus]|uniref:hypothetical protein n=1 Tax=Paenibacillus luteus TaxID=2545753 RepID=UPI0011414044|nr:hypothetical protein [Paenibacillus luteus]
MQTTGNLGLKKPEGTDVVDIADLNGNADIIDTAVAGKVDKEAGKGLSANDYTAAEKTKLAGVAAGANAYVHPTGDGNLHIPATGTTNTGRVLTAGSTSGSVSWANIPIDTTRAPLVSPVLTGTPTAPTAVAGTNTTQIATTSFVNGAVNLKANLTSPNFTGVPTAPTAVVGSSTTQLATTAFVRNTLSDALPQNLTLDAQSNTANAWSLGLVLNYVNSSNVKTQRKIEVSNLGDLIFTIPGLASYAVSHAGKSLIEARFGSDPVSPVVGQMWLRTDL